MRAGGLASILVLLLAFVPAVPGASADGCGLAGAPPAWFLGVVHSDGMEDWAREDVDHFEGYLAKLRQSYCIPTSNAKVLAFWNGYTAHGKTYETGSEANVKAYLAAFGAASRGVPDAHLFFALSSHGNANPNECPTGLPRLGSFSALRSGGGEDGILQDCELGHALNVAFDPATRMWIIVDCSFCGGFSDSLTAMSGTVPDLQVPRTAGIVRANRVVITGCAITTECFGSTTGDPGSTTYAHLAAILDGPMSRCDGWTAPGFPIVQGVNVPAHLGETDGKCSASEWFYGAVQDTYNSLDAIGVQQQYRMKWGFSDVADDIVVK